MDVLRPPIIRIGNRCYRKNPYKTQAGEDEDYKELTSDTGIVDQCWDDELCDADLNIEETENGFRIAMAIPSVYFKFIIGKKGETRRRIETETQTQIRIPKAGQEGDVVICGHHRNGVISAKTRIDVVVDSARQRQPFTHFLSIPFTSAAIQEKLEEFKSDVLRECTGDRGIDPTIFQKPEKLHLTLGTLTLMTDSDTFRALQVLDECMQDLVIPLLKDVPLKCRVTGLEYMNDDPNAVDVLYAKVELDDGSDRLQLLADRILEQFISANLMQREYDRVKVHITVMNTLFRKDPSGTSVVRTKQFSAKERESFDAFNVLRKFGNYDFGPYHINTVHLSQRNSTGKDGYYASSGCITLP